MQQHEPQRILLQDRRQPQDCIKTKGWGSGGKETTCNVGDLGSIPGSVRSPGEGKGTPVLWPGESQGLYSPWGRKELDRTE